MKYLAKLQSLVVIGVLGNSALIQFALAVTPAQWVQSYFPGASSIERGSVECGSEDHEYFKMAFSSPSDWSVSLKDGKYVSPTPGVNSMESRTEEKHHGGEVYSSVDYNSDYYEFDSKLVVSHFLSAHWDYYGPANRQYVSVWISGNSLIAQAVNWEMDWTLSLIPMIRRASPKVAFDLKDCKLTAQ